jgi:hypothetical protein
VSGKFLIKLAAVHKKSGLSPYAVARATGLNENTVRRYVTEDVPSERIYSHIVTLTDFYGVDWRDPAIIEWVSDSKEEQSPEMKTALVPML